MGHTASPSPFAPSWFVILKRTYVSGVGNKFWSPSWNSPILRVFPEMVQITSFRKFLKLVNGNSLLDILKDLSFLGVTEEVLLTYKKSLETIIGFVILIIEVWSCCVFVSTLPIKSNGEWGAYAKILIQPFWNVSWP